MNLKRDEILKLFDEHESLLLDRPIRNYEVVRENVDFMQPLIQRWTTGLDNALTNLDSLKFDSLANKEITPELEHIYQSVSCIMAIADTLKGEIVVSEIESTRKELHDAVLKSLSVLINHLFFAFHPNADYRHSESIIPMTVSALKVDKAHARRIATKLETLREKNNRDSRNLKHLLNSVASTRAQFFLILACFAMLLILEAADLQSDTTIAEFKVLARIFSVLVATLI